LTFDGKEGRSAYVAVDQVVYDVTNMPHWINGEHHGRMAGHDLSESIKKRHKSIFKARHVPVVGKLTSL
jgi:predicted heme/steroid binding protein